MTYVENHKFTFVSLYLAKNNFFAPFTLFIFQGQLEKSFESKSGREVYKPSGKEHMADGEETH